MRPKKFNHAATGHPGLVLTKAGDMSHTLDVLGARAEEAGITMIFGGDSNQPSQASPDNPFIFEVVCLFPDEANRQRFLSEIWATKTGKGCVNLREHQANPRPPPSPGLPPIRLPE